MKNTILMAFTLLFVAVGGVAIWIFLLVPSDEEIKGCMVAEMNQVNLCPGSRDYVRLSQISNFLQRAVIISEDASFWTHQGFDWEQLEKSARENFEKGSYKRGGSTITQQLVKNLFLTRHKTLVRKGLEALITIRVEKVLKKNEILERYLNVVELGPKIYGVKAASRHYFGKSAAELDLLESAFLAMLLPSPVKYSISFNKKSLSPFARQRVRRIMTDLKLTGRVSQEEFDAGMARMDSIFGGDPAEVISAQEMEEELSFDEDEPPPAATTVPVPQTSPDTPSEIGSPEQIPSDALEPEDSEASPESADPSADLEIEDGP
jgi:monofunctional biosynthetic peptidoglycan transglycosylase